MFAHLVHKVQNAAARTARKAALGLGAAICIAVGLGFLTAAAWLFIISVTTALNAALIIGGAYCGLGLVLIGMASADGPKRSTPPHSTQAGSPQKADDIAPQIIEAFLTGLKAGQRSRS